MFEWGLIAVSGAILGRALFWHVPQMIAMLGNYCHDCASWFGDHEIFCDRYRCPTPPVPPPPIDYEAIENRLFMACPSAFWLEPGRWQRRSWPAEPTLADLRYDNTPADMALAYTLCDEDQREALARHGAAVHISSQRRWDRYQGRRMYA